MSASTLNDQTHGFAEVVSPIYDYLQRLAANAWLLFSDDTGIKILKLKSEVKVQRKTLKETLRTGVHTSAVLARLDGGIQIGLFKSGILHAGEFIDEILGHRDEGIAVPIHMADGSSCNPATVVPTIQAACNAHGRRKLSEKRDNYPEHWEVVKRIYKEVYGHDATTKEHGLSPEERLEYHKKHSRPLMDQMFDWMAGELNLKNVEPNSQLGGIFEYFLARRKELLAFTEYAGAPLDNNVVEQLIKLVALLRKNAMFFMSLTGAQDADKIMSVGATAGMAGVNLFDYFVCLQRHASLVKKAPETFLPWTYQETVRAIKQVNLSHGTPPEVLELTAEDWKERQDRIRLQRVELRKNRFATKRAVHPRSGSA